MRKAIPKSGGRLPAIQIHLVAGIVAGSLTMVGVACAPDPRIERQANALDVSGQWVEASVEGRPPARVTIENEASTNDVRVTITDRAIGADEAGLIAGLVDDGDRAGVTASLVLGAGADVLLAEAEGGENVSLDDGATTTVLVVGPAFAATAGPGADDATVRWSLRLEGTGEGLAGELFITASERRPVVDDSDGTARRSTRVTVPLRLVPAAL